MEYINNYGVTLMRLGQLWEAKAAFERALEMNPNFDNANRNLIDLTMYMRQVGKETTVCPVCGVRVCCTSAL